MTNREAQIFQWITENPMISQEELAAKAGIARSSAAVHISNLMKKGYILGKGYVTNGPSYCMVIGGANIDIGGTPDGELIDEDSNPGRTMQSLGGVGRNVAHNLRLLGVGVKFITAIGDDAYAQKIIENCTELGIDIADALKTAKADTSTYLYISDAKGDMKLAVSDMRIYENLTPDFIAPKMEQLNRARMVILDTNIPAETIALICEKCKAPVFADPVSTKKAEKLLPVLDKLYVATPNKLEAEVLSGISITDRDSLERAADIILEKGVKNVFITMGKAGVYCASDEEQFMMNGLGGELVNATGAGDAFMAGVSLGFMKHMGIRQMAKLGLAAASLTIEADQTINPQLCIPAVAQRAKMEL
ncbi:MAG: winged helix-turn-helix transcriptional regulator [Lachnospiraceae bacterium]|nr:winged helix-turn-helix transcriptional regulator [Lachnospiraceae bacterium]MBO5146583.1 winged helix-turn-helix transcriptional regulator [Lachnospiraceae bacterium]